MKKKMYTLFAFISFLLVLSSTKNISYADDGNVGFNIQMIPSENQINKDVSYFDLRIDPGQKQTIKVRINNTSDEKNTYTMNINQAYTNDQGFIDYSSKENSENNDVPYKIKDIVSYESKITIDAQSSKEVPIEISMPEKPFDGQISSGIQILKDQESSNNQIDVDYGYILGLKLTETDNTISRKMKLLDVKPEAKFGDPSIIATLKNPTMDAYGHLKYQVDIVDKSDNQLFFSKTYENNMEMAPNSTFEFAITMGNQRLVAGDYTLKIKVSDAKENSWNLSKDFSVSKKEAENINRITIDKAKEKKIPYLVITISILAILVSSFLVFLSAKKRKTLE